MKSSLSILILAGAVSAGNIQLPGLTVPAEFAAHKQDVVDIFKPSDETVARVTEWLVGAGIGKDRLKISASKGWIELNTTIEEAEALIDAEYHVYEHPSGAEQIGKAFLHSMWIR